MQIEYTFEKLDKDCHDRSNFDCGVDVLNVFLARRANQEQSKNLSVTYVATELSGTNLKKKIFGYYTLSNSAMNLECLPEQLQKGIPSTYIVPTIRIGRLARGLRYSGLGRDLLKDALLRIHAISETVGIKGIEVDAKDEDAKMFYQKAGFLDLAAIGNSLFLPTATISRAIERQDQKIFSVNQLQAEESCY